MKRTILEILSDRDISKLDKKIAVEKFKFNHLPSWYRKEHREDIAKKIEKMKGEEL